jgi:hypothetical protein
MEKKLRYRLLAQHLRERLYAFPYGDRERKVRVKGGYLNLPHTFFLILV